MQDINPKVSIIIPVYNTEKYIKECLDSCINQTLKEIEILIIDDVGEDKSINIALEYVKKDSRIKIFRNEKNLGLFLSRQEGVKKANAPYITFLDSDDFLDLKACELTYNAAVENGGGWEYICFGTYSWQKNQKTILHHFKEQKFQSQEEYVKWFYQQKYFVWNICGNLIKKDKILEAILMIDMEKTNRLIIAEDVLYSFTIKNLCEKFINLPDILYFYRYNPLSSTNRINNDTLRAKLEDYDLVINKILELSSNYKIHSKLLKLYLSCLSHERKYTKYLKDKNNGSLTLKDKIKFWFHHRVFTIKRKLRVKLGI